jgi:hypothetical protein
MELINDTSQQQYWLTIPEAVSTVILLLKFGEGIAQKL